MCLAIPGKIEKILEDNYAIADFGGVKKRICIDFLKGVKVGEYVNVHVGFAINKISEKEARENLRIIRQTQ